MKSKFGLLTALLLAVSASASANLITNGSFEDVPGSGTGEGLMPSSWVALNGTPSTFSNDGSFGVDPTFNNSFSGVVAQDGTRWVAGSTLEPGEFGQILAAPLTEGESYRLGGWIHRSSRTDLPDDGGFVVSLMTETDAERIIGFMDVTASYEWEFRGFEFTAPTANFIILKFSPISGGADGSYMGLDNVNMEVVPEPGTVVALTVGGLLLIRKRRSS